MRIIFSTLLIFLLNQSYGLDRVLVNRNITSMDLLGTTYMHVDSTKSLTVENVLELSQEEWEKKALSGYTPNVNWLKLPLLNASAESYDKVLYVNNNFLHELDFYFVVDGKLQEGSIATGMSRSRNSKLYNDPRYPVNVHFPANSKVDIYIRVYGPMATNNTPLFLMSFDKAIELKDNRLMTSFLWAGVLILSITLSLFLYISIRQKIFFYYIFLGIATGIIISASTGLVMLFIDKDPFVYTTNYYLFGAAILNNFMPRFLNCIVPVSQLNQWAWKAIKIVGYCCLALAAFYLIPSVKTTFYFVSFVTESMVRLSGIVFLYLMITLFIAAIKRWERAIVLFIVYFVYLSLAFGVIIFPFFDINSNGLNTVYFMLHGSIFETVAFMLLMAQVTLSVYKEKEKLNLQVQSNQELMMNAIVKGQEDERKRFAQDLHDGFGQLISSLNLNLKSLETTKTTDTEKRIGIFNVSKSILEEMYVELKNICFNLMPQTLIAVGVGDALREFASRINKSEKIRLNVSFFQMDDRLEQVQEISFYRISQEWINNIIKYSDATVIDLQITKDDNEITLIIEDNGSGFEKRLLTSGKGNGWKNISSRASLIKGEVELDTTPGFKGNTFILNAPVNIGNEELARATN
ncbi:MAG: hypothetical protein JXQ96_08790 [Cyclobacteriaceae bacterium]